MFTYKLYILQLLTKKMRFTTHNSLQTNKQKKRIKNNKLLGKIILK